MRGILLTLALGALANAAAVPAKSNVPTTQLTAENFTPAKMPGSYLVRFTSPNCDACDVLESLWIDAYSKVGKDSVTNWVDVDCSTETELCDTQGIYSVPRLVAYEQGVKVSGFDFSDTTKASDLVEFSKKVAGRPSAKMNDAAPLPEHKAEPKTDETSAEQKPETKKDAEEAPQEEITSLNSETFNPEVLKGTWIIKFFSPYCPHCIDFAPKYLDAYTKLGGKEGTTKLGAQMAEVNCVEQGDLCGQEGITYFPVVKTYIDGKEVNIFDGDLDAQGVIGYFRKQVGTEGAHASATATTATTATGAAAATAAATKSSKVAVENGVPVSEWADFTVSHSDGTSHALTKENFETLVTDSNEPWLIKFFSPSCHHCKAMAPAWTEFSKTAAGHVNVGEVNCLEEKEFCKAYKIKAWPTVRYYKGRAHIAEYENVERTAEDFTKFVQVQSGSLVLPMENEAELKKALANNAKSGISTFVYFHDEAIASEDWFALVTLAEQLEEYSSVVYRTQNKELKESSFEFKESNGIAFVDQIPGQDPLYWYTLPDGSLPTVTRDVKKVLEWATSVRYAAAQPLTLPEAKHMGSRTPLTAILVTGSGGEKAGLEEQLKGFRLLAHQFWSDSLQQQQDDKERLRTERKDMYKSAQAAAETQKAREIYLTKIETQMRPQISFAYITLEELQHRFSPYMNTAKKNAGDLIVVDFHKGRYIDEINGVTITNIHGIQAAIDEFNNPKSKSIRRAKRLDGVREPPKYKRPVFEVPRPRVLGGTFTFFIFAIIIGLILIVATRLGYIRPFSRHNGPILTGKMD